ncbi:MAG: hypothetical protein MUE85_14530 [Microscillaceae bacterium]|jgi:hypothetical protein|nr:hypothetical protein [Microscillaceae bacterium]
MSETRLTIQATGESSYQALDPQDKVVYSFEYFWTEDYCLHHWQCYLPDNDIIFLYEYSIDFFNRTGASPARSLTDITTYDGSFDGINEYLVTSLLPRVLAMGFRAGATVLPEDFFAQLALEEYQAMAQDLPYKQGYFASLEDAKTWLLEQ